VFVTILLGGRRVCEARVVCLSVARLFAVFGAVASIVLCATGTRKYGFVFCIVLCAARKVLEGSLLFIKYGFPRVARWVWGCSN